MCVNKYELFYFCVLQNMDSFTVFMLDRPFVTHLIALELRYEFKCEVYCYSYTGWGEKEMKMCSGVSSMGSGLQAPISNF